MPNKPTDIERITHMIQAINRISTYTADLDYKKFSQQNIVQDAVMKNFEVLGEAAYHVSKEIDETWHS